MTKYILFEETPTAVEYNYLRHAADWPVYQTGMVEIALLNSFYAVVVRTTDGNAVGMGRVVSDGAIYFHVQDVIVHPGHQRKGIGRMIMDALMRRVDAFAGRHTNIGLMCSKGREKFYTDLGFIARPNDTFRAGMIMIKD